MLRLLISGIILLLSLLLLACQHNAKATPTLTTTPPASMRSVIVAPTPSIAATPTVYQARVEIDETTLFIRCEGAGSPTGIREAGPGDFWVTWQKVIPGVATFTHVCAYDRAGLGASSSGPTPRTSQQMAVELRSLLTSTNVTGPYVLVTHATGNWIARIFAGEHPEDVAVTVFVSPMHEGMLSPIRLINCNLLLWAVANFGPYLPVYLLSGQPYYQGLPVLYGGALEVGLLALNAALPLW